MFPKATVCNIGYGVTGISNDAFKGCSALKTISIPSSVKDIGDRFISETSVSEINWSTLDPSQVTTYSNTFSNGSVARTVYFPTKAALDKVPSGKFGSNYTKAVSGQKAHDFQTPGHQHFFVATKAGTSSSQGEMAFVAGSDASLNYTVTYTYDTTYGGNGATYSCTSVAPYAFHNNTSIWNAILQYSGIKTIGERAFYGCSALQTVTFGSGVTSIGNYAFTYCTGVRTVNWNAGNYVNSDNTNLLLTLFGSTANITTVTIGSTVTKVPDFMCYGLTKLTSLTIANSVTSIGKYAFHGCTDLTTVTLPSSLTTIGADAFRETGLTSLALPSSLTTIGSTAFYKCDKLQSIAIPSRVEILDSGVFSYCTALQTVTIGSGVKSIATGAFNGCTALRTINWNAATGPTWTAASQSPFYDLRGNITAVNFGNTVTRVPPYLCYGFNKLTTVSLPLSVASIGDYAFNDCKVLTTVGMSSGVESIGNYAFAGCASLLKVDFYSKLTSLGQCAFNGCSALTKVDLSATRLTSVPKNAFNSCTGLTQLSLPETLTTIEEQAFLFCSGLKKVTLPEGVETLGLGAFANCTGLTTFSLPQTVTSIGNYAFLNNKSLRDFYALPRCADIEMGSDVFNGVPKTSTEDPACTLHVKQGQLEAYKAANQWKDFYNIVGDQEDPDYNPNKFDVNNDGDVNVGDVNAVLEAILNNWVDDKFNVNNDDGVDVGDVNAILEYILAH